MLFFVVPMTASAKKIRVLIVGGGTSHDFDRWYKQADAATLERDGLCSVVYTSNTDSISFYLKSADVLYLVTNQPINAASRKAIFDFVDAGKGLVLGHPGLWYNWKDWPEYNRQLVSGGAEAHDKYGSFDEDIVNPNHPITKGVEQHFNLKDERYHYVVDPLGPGIEVLASNHVAGSDVVYPSVFIVKNPKTRIVCIALGHDDASHNIIPYQTLLRNAVKWVAHKS
ncbi:ThuA domain-containing protein [Mucilaginibacter sp. dw_454]|uniref:ThuA domain-containing protein n=1 Tax=Mucilaginibacter sp. dw_454 TaxID=2720079 RepID=UPI001BD1DDE7|nr:ThuA domain-containing protein [Mucilaginibacter sp. dw_454]